MERDGRMWKGFEGQGRDRRAWKGIERHGRVWKGMGTRPGFGQSLMGLCSLRHETRGSLHVTIVSLAPPERGQKGGGEREREREGGKGQYRAPPTTSIALAR
eukprot:3464544-Rhodomonas_salina.1